MISKITPNELNGRFKNKPALITNYTVQESNKVKPKRLTLKDTCQDWGVTNPA